MKGIFALLTRGQGRYADAMRLLHLSVPIVALALTLRAGGADTHTINEWKLGAHIAGPQITLDDAKGKAVLIDYWGIHCGPCLASLPDIEKIARRNKDKMLVIGAHSQEGTDAEVQAVVKKNHLSYTITNGAHGPISISAIPHVMVFDTEGQMIFDGHPADKEFERSIRKATQGASATNAASKPSGLDALKR